MLPCYYYYYLIIIMYLEFVILGIYPFQIDLCDILCP